MSTQKTTLNKRQRKIQNRNLEKILSTNNLTGKRLTVKTPEPLKINFKKGGMYTEELNCFNNVFNFLGSYVQKNPLLLEKFQIKPVFCFQINRMPSTTGVRLLPHAVISFMGKIKELTPSSVMSHYDLVLCPRVDFTKLYRIIATPVPGKPLPNPVALLPLAYPASAKLTPRADDLQFDEILRLCSFDEPEPQVPEQPLFIPDEIFAEIASFHCYLPQERREELAAQPHIQELKTMIRQEYDEYHDGVVTVKWWCGTPWYRLYLRLYVDTRTTRLVQVGDSDEEFFWENRVIPRARYNITKWFDGHYHFGFDPMHKDWLSKYGIALICTDQPTQEQIALASSYGKDMVNLIQNGKSPEEIIKILKYLNSSRLRNCIITVFTEDSWEDDYCYGWRDIFQTNHKCFLEQLKLGRIAMTQ